ncbi:MAG: phosphonatase-like hydrolase [Acidobacteriota bacterium]
MTNGERPRLVVLDMAGTTVRDDGQVPGAFREALAAAGVTVSDDAVAGVRGASKREAVAALLPDGPDRVARAAAVYADFHVRLADRFAAGVSEVPGAAAAIRALRARGIRVAFGTGFDRDIATMLLAALGWTDLADAVVCGDEVGAGRPAPDLIRRAMALTGMADPSAVAAAGDTVLDLRAGAAAGVGWNIGVLSGAHDRATLAREPHTHLVASVADLPALWP